MTRAAASPKGTVPETRATHEVVSPVTGEVIDRVAVAGLRDISEVLRQLCSQPTVLSRHETFQFLDRLRTELVERRDLLCERTALETGFILRDCAETIDAAIEFLRDFEVHVQDGAVDQRQVVRHSYSGHSPRDMMIAERPYRCIAAVVPQNASLALGITIIASALYAGCRVVLRPSLQSASTGALLAEMVRKAGLADTQVAIVNCLASDFVAACCADGGVNLLHYIGSNQYALSVFQQAFTAGKICILDGQGNGLVYVDKSYPIDEAARLITAGATRFNGETCTSVNGVLVHEEVYGELREALVESFRGLQVGDPAREDVHVGPLFGVKQARVLRSTLQVPHGTLLCGGQSDGPYFSPAVLEGVRLEDSVVTEGFFGPAVWIHPVAEDAAWAWLRANRFPLSDAVLSRRPAVIQAVVRNSRAARICVNEDPSIESMFEPWGGYPPSGLNPVSVWRDKYRQTFQLDGRLDDILMTCSDLGHPRA